MKIGVKEPDKLKRLSPKAITKKINELIDYAVATHIDSIQFEASKNEVISARSGLTIKLKG